MEPLTQRQILAQRAEIELDLIELLKETGSDFSLQDVKDAIFQEEDTSDMMKVVAMFDRGGDTAELGNIIELVTDAWNYFPHQLLGGLSPEEKATRSAPSGATAQGIIKTFTDCFKIILTGDREASRKAARGARKLLYSSRGDSGRYQDIKNIINNAPSEYVEISEDWRQENFVMAISVLYFLHDRESQPDFLFPWLYYLIQNSNGNIRQAAVRMFGHEIGPLTYHLRFPGEQSPSLGDIPPRQADRILHDLFANLFDLLWRSDKPAYQKHKYIESMPSGPHKSVQMVVSHLDECCGAEYMAHLAGCLGLRQR